MTVNNTNRNSSSDSDDLMILDPMDRIPGRDANGTSSADLPLEGANLLSHRSATATNSKSSSDDQLLEGLSLLLPVIVILLVSFKLLWSKIIASWTKPASETEVIKSQPSLAQRRKLTLPPAPVSNNKTCSSSDSIQSADSPCPSAGSATSNDESSRSMSDKGQEDKRQNAATGSTLERELMLDLVAQNKLLKATMEEQSIAIQQIKTQLQSRDDRLVEVEADRDRKVKELSDQVAALSISWRRDQVERLKGEKGEGTEWRNDMEKRLEALHDLVKQREQVTTSKQNLIEKELAVRMQGIKEWLKAFEKNQMERLESSQDPKEELQTLTAELSDVRRDMEVKSKQVNELAHYLQQEDVLIAKLMDSFETVVSKVEHVTERAHSQQVQVSAIQRTIQSKDEELASRVDQLEKEINDGRDLRGETIQSIQVECASLMRKIESLTKDHQQTTKEVKECRGKEVEYVQELEGLKLRCLSQHEQSLRLSATLEELSVNVASSISSHNEIRQASQTHTKEMALRIESLVQELNLREEQHKRELETLKSQLSQVQTEHNSSRARHDDQVLELRGECERRLSESSEAIKSLDQELRLLKQNKLILSKSEQGHRETTKKMVASVEELQERLDFELITHQASYDNQVKGLKSALQTLEGKHHCLSDAMQQSHVQSLSHSRKVADEINTSSRGLQGSIDSMNTELISLKSQILAQQEDLVKVTESHAKLRSQVICSQGMEVASKEAHEELTSRVIAALSRIGGLEKQLEDAIETNEDNGAELSRQIDVLSGKIDSHHEISVAYQKDTECEASDLRSALQQLGNKLQNGLTAQEENCDQLGRRCRDLEQCLDDLSKEVESRGVERSTLWQQSIPEGVPTQVEVALTPSKDQKDPVQNLGEEDHSSVRQLSAASPTYHSAAVETPGEEDHGSAHQLSTASPTYHSTAIENPGEEDHNSVRQLSTASPTYHSTAIENPGGEDHGSGHQLSTASPTYHSTAIENPGEEDHNSVRQLSTASPTYHSTAIENPGEEDHGSHCQLSTASPTYQSAAIENSGEQDLCSVRQLSTASPTYHSAAIENPGEEDLCSICQLSTASPTYHSAAVENPEEEGHCSVRRLSAASPTYYSATDEVEGNEIQNPPVMPPEQKDNTQPDNEISAEALCLLTKLMAFKAELIRRTQSVIELERYTKERSDDFCSRAEVLNNEIELQRRQLKKWEETTHTTETRWVEKCDELHRINTEITRLQDQVQAVKGEITNLQDALEEDGLCNGLRLRLEGQLRAQNDLLNEVKEKLRNSELCAATCETECSNLTAKRELFEDELERRKTRVSKLRSNLSGVLDLVAEERAALQQELLVKRQQRDLWQDKTEDLYLCLKETKRENPNLDLHLSESFVVGPESAESKLFAGPTTSAPPRAVSELEPSVPLKEERPQNSTAEDLRVNRQLNAEQAETGHKLAPTQLEEKSEEVAACAALQDDLCRTKEALKRELEMSREHRVLLAEKMDKIAADRGKAERLEVQLLGLHHTLEKNQNQIGQVKEEQLKLGSDLNARVEALENDIRNLEELQQEAAHEEPNFDILTKKIEALATDFSSYGEIVAKVGALGNSIERCEGQLQSFEKDKDDTKADISSMIDLFKSDLQALKHSFEENLNNKDAEFSCLLAKVENLVNTSQDHEKQLGVFEGRLQAACKRAAGDEEEQPKAQILPEHLLQQMMEKYVDLAAKIDLLATELGERDRVLERRVQDRDSLYIAQMDAVRSDLESQQARYQDEMQVKVYNTMLNVFKALAKRQGLPSGFGAWSSAEESLALSLPRANNGSGRDKESSDKESGVLVPKGRRDNQSARPRQRGGVGYSMASGIITDNLFLPVIMAATPVTNTEKIEEGKTGDS